MRGDISNVYVGNYTSIAQGVIFDCGFHHNVKAVSTYPFQTVNHKYSGIGLHPISRGVVTKSVSPYEVVAGIPAKHIKFRFDPDSIKKLLKIKWWDWEEEIIEKYVPSLVSNNIDEFLLLCAIMDINP